MTHSFRTRSRSLTGIALFFASLVGSVALAQEYRGNLYVHVMNADGQPVPGATVTLEGPDFSRRFTVDAAGDARFIRLEPGRYNLDVAATGFQSVRIEGVEVNTLANIDYPVTLGRIEVPAERIVVSAATPLLDQRKTGTSTVLTQEELSQIPTSRDPWAVLSTVPGITTDRVNVAGNEAGQQSNFVTKGDDGGNTTWVMDGVEFTDLGAIGSSPTYFDFNTFEEIGFVTGGADVDQPNGGARLNFTTKQGTNQVSGNVRLWYTEEGLQSDGDSLSQPANVTVDPTVPLNVLPENEIAEVFEKNFNLGGPIWKDHIWYWFGFGQNDIDNLITGQSDKTKLTNTTIKIHGQAATRFNWKLFYTNGDKTKDGRGLAPTRPPETTWDQKGPTPIYTAYGSYFVTPDFEVSAQIGHVDGKFSLTPKGGSDTQIINDANNVWHGSYLFYDTVRPQDQVVVRGANFFDTGDWSHELKYGYRYKSSEVESISKWSNSDFFVYSGAYVYLYRERNFSVDMTHHNAWVGDTVVKDNWAFTAGLTYTLQSGENQAATVPAAGICPTCLPGLSYPGSGKVFEWEDVSPRAGLTYTFDTKHRLLLRANYSRYVDQLFVGDIQYDNPAAGYIYITQAWTDTNLNEQVDAGEFSTDCNTATNSSVDPCNPNGFFDRIDPDYEAPRTDEVIVGAEYELAQDFTVGANLLWRTRDRDRWIEGNLDGRPVSANGPLYDVPHFNATGQLRPIPSTGYDCSTLLTGMFPDGTPYSEPICDLNALGTSLTTDANPTFLTNRPGYEQEYNGIEFTATKRLSHKWMLRGYLALNDWTQSFEGTSGISDPTNFQGGTAEQDGDISVPSVGSGTKDGVWLGTSNWQANINGLYQLPRDWTISANLYGREGYGIPYIDRRTDPDPLPPDLPGKDVQVGEIDDRSYDDLWTVDLGVGRLIRLGGSGTLELRGEIFNAFNANTVLSRNVRVDQPGNTDAITENLSPRIIRLGVSINF